MTDKFDRYLNAEYPIPKTQKICPLFGAGFERLGVDDVPIKAPVPEIKDDELLVRHDAVGLCFSDIKVINQGQTHPRIYKNMQQDPVVLGHEVSMTVVKVGSGLIGEYSPGDRFTIQADVFVDGIGYAYGYEIQGGLSQFNVIDQRILNGDAGNYLIPVQRSTGYAESALTEPWACVAAAYQLTYRTQLKPAGIVWIIGTDSVQDGFYEINHGFDETSHPAKVYYSNLPAQFFDWLKVKAEALGIELCEIPRIEDPPDEQVDDLIILGSDPALVEVVSPCLADYGVVALITDEPFSRQVNIDIGRVHYNRWVYVGCSGNDIGSAYISPPVRSSLKAWGTSWFIGAGGPMGQMHVQRAIQSCDPPGKILCTDVNDIRLEFLYSKFADQAQERDIEFYCLNPQKIEAYQTGLAQFPEGFDDIIILAPVPALIAQAEKHLAKNGVINVFAGLSRGVMAAANLNNTIFQGARVIGHSASSKEDLELMLRNTEAGELSPNRSVSAVGSLNAAKDGLLALENGLYPGKVVIYPQIRDLPLTSLEGLKEKMPTVWNLLEKSSEWTNEAEKEFLHLMLP